MRHGNDLFKGCDPILVGIFISLRLSLNLTRSHLRQQGESYLYLPGVMMIENAAGQRRYLLPDGLGLIRQAISDTAQVVAYYEFNPYGNPVNNTTDGEPYGFVSNW